MAGTQLDARVWGKLQDHDLLQSIHEKVPYKDFFRLGAVCKSWKQVTLQRVEPNPYFVTINLGVGKKMHEVQYLNGVFNYDVPTGKLSWRRQHFALHGYSPLEVKGLIYCNHPDNANRKAVFNIHSGMWHFIPPPPEMNNSKSALGMTVDTSETPHSFKLFLGCIDRKTQIYDSRAGSWSSRSSYLVKLPPTSAFASCICSKGCVYFSQGHREMILMYSIERDFWTMLQGPPWDEGQDPNDDTLQLGTWKGRVFTTRENRRQSCIVVWESIDQMKNEWVEYARISVADCEWLFVCDIGNYDGPPMSMVTCFCGQYMLIYYWQFNISRINGLLLFNLATKECQKVELRRDTIVAMEVQENEDDEDDDFVYTDSEAGE